MNFYTLILGLIGWFLGTVSPSSVSDTDIKPCENETVSAKTKRLFELYLDQNFMDNEPGTF
jgi:hypothetical protein